MENKEDIIEDEELDSEEEILDEEESEEEDEKPSSKDKKEKKSKEVKPTQQKVVSDNFTKAIQSYLDGFAAKDEHFSNCYKNPKKSIVECCAYIVGQVQKMGVIGLSDDEVYQMARHYYLEDIDPKELQIIYQPNQVVSNTHIELSEEEKAQAKERALKEYKDKCIKAEEERARKEEEKAQKKAEAAAKKKEEQEAKRKAEEANPNYFQLGLFDFLQED